MSQSLSLFGEVYEPADPPAVTACPGCGGPIGRRPLCDRCSAAGVEACRLALDAPLVDPSPDLDPAEARAHLVSLAADLAEPVADCGPCAYCGRPVALLPVDSPAIPCPARSDDGRCMTTAEHRRRHPDALPDADWQPCCAMCGEDLTVHPVDPSQPDCHAVCLDLDADWPEVF